MAQQELIPNQIQTEVAPTVRRGPPNRMNDLDYSTWMKFQKSFFWFDSFQAVVDECIYFFTKAVWSNGEASASLVVSSTEYQSLIPTPRQVRVLTATTLENVASSLRALAEKGELFDFVLLDLSSIIATPDDLELFLSDHAQNIFSTMRQLLIADRYCAVFVGSEAQGGGGFPLPWAIGTASRRHLKLRDEKVGLVKANESIIYCLFMQSQDDEFQPEEINRANLRNVSSEIDIPAWIMPKSPPRKKHEILHPAKYPETLVSPFIELFTHPGDTVLDPMVGTGSTVIAALRCERNGFGVDLVQEFVEIARSRVAEELQPMLFAEFQSSRDAVIMCGDATRLNEYPMLSDRLFEYAITSPPYWSMLSNPGSENQEARRQKQLRLVYSDVGSDLGNIADYHEFLEMLVEVYRQVAAKLTSGGYLTVVVKNVKRDHTLYTLAWDLSRLLCGLEAPFNYVGCTLWCQDDIPLKPFAVGTHWVSNTLHNYCLHFRKR